MCLLWGADLRLRLSWQLSKIQDPRKMWSATGSLLTVWWRIPSLGSRLPIASGSGCPLAASQPPEWGGAGPQPASSPLVIAQSFFCEQPKLCLRLEDFLRKFSVSLFFSSLWLSHSLGCYLTLAPSDCLQGIQAQSLP